MEFQIYMQRLDKLARNLGVSMEEEEPEVDTSSMTKWERGKYECAALMHQVRQHVKELDNCPSQNVTKKAALSNRIRKGLAEAKQRSASSRRDATNEGCMDQFNIMQQQLKRTEALYRQRFRSAGTLADESSENVLDASLPGASSSSSYRTFDEIRAGEGGRGGGGGMRGEQEELLDPLQDEEFQMFMAESRRKNEHIDQGLIKVHAGLGRIKYQALETRDELEQQAVLLDNVNQNAADVAHKLRGVNGRLKDTVKQVDRDKFCVYLICLLLVLGVLSVVLTQSGLR